MLPKEHGAYGQLGFPLVTAFAVAGVSAGGALIAIAAIAAFLAHEPATVLLGQRGVRAAREQRRQALFAFAVCAATAALAGAATFAFVPRASYWALLIPLTAAVMLAITALRGREKSWFGEVIAALAFSMVSVPVAVAGGTPPVRALAIAIPFALLFVLSTLAVRVAILRVRAGGDPVASARTRLAVFIVAAVAAAALTALALAARLPWAVVGASVPGLVVATTVAAVPPSPRRLRTVGWTLVGTSLVTAALVIYG